MEYRTLGRVLGFQSPRASPASCRTGTFWFRRQRLLRRLPGDHANGRRRPSSSSTSAWKPAATSSTPPTATPTAQMANGGPRPGHQAPQARRCIDINKSHLPLRPRRQQRRQLALPPHRPAPRQPEAPADRLHRRLPHACLRRHDARRRDTRHAEHIRARRQGPLHRLLQLLRLRTS